MKKPVASNAAFHREVKKWSKWLGTTHPWSFAIVVGDGSVPAHGEDSEVYACCEPSPNYYFARLHFDPYHSGWETKEKGEIGPCVRHEMIHALISPLTMYAYSLARGNKDVERALNDLEEQVTTTLETMPVWDLVE